MLTSLNKQILRWLPAIASVFALLYLLTMADRGFDFTDESSYLNWITDPWLYPLSVTQYGFVYHPAFALLGGDVAALRRFNIIVTFLLGCGLGIAVLRSLAPQSKLSEQIALATQVGFVALLIVANWLPTPNYNSLNLQGLLISAIALCLISLEEREAWNRRALLSYALLGFGGWLVFMAKPTSAVLLAPVSLVYLTSLRRLLTPGTVVAIAVAFTLLLGSAIYIDGSVTSFISRLSDAAQLSATMDSTYSAGRIFRIDTIYFTSLDWLQFCSLACLIGAATVLSNTRNPRFQMFACITVSIAVLSSGVALAGVTNFGLQSWSSWSALKIGAVLLGAILAALCLLRYHKLPRLSRSQVAMIGMLIVLPYANAVGTNGNYWPTSGYAGIFWVCAALLLAGTRDAQVDGRQSVLAGLALSIAILILSTGLQFPYRQLQPVQDNVNAIQIGGSRAELLVSGQFAQYVNDLQALADKGGFVQGTPVIDLTGHYPGAVFALGGTAVGQAWMIGGYPGSDDLARASLARVTCDLLARSWLLVEEGGPRALSSNVTALEGASYEGTAAIASPTGSYPQSYAQRLLLPTHNAVAVTAACEEKRNRQSESMSSSFL